MSLLLDALKDAEENRKTVEPSGDQPHDEWVGEIDLETEFELAIELDKNQDSAGVVDVKADEAGGEQEKNKKLRSDVSDTAKGLNSSEPVVSNREESDTHNRRNNERGMKGENSDYESALDDDYVAEAVFKTQNKGRSVFFKVSLLVCLLCVAVLVAGYYWLLKEPDSLDIINLQSSDNIEERMKEKVFNSTSSEVLNKGEAKTETLSAVIVGKEETNRTVAIEDPQNNKEVDKVAMVKATELGVIDDIKVVVGDDKAIKESEPYIERDMNVVAENSARLEANVEEREVEEVKERKVEERDGAKGENGITPLLLNQSSATVSIHKRHIPNQKKINLNQGKQAIAKGKWSSAENIFRRVLAESPNNTEALIYMADIMTVKGEKEIALSLYFKALEKSPGNLEASVGLLGLTEDKKSLNYGSQLKQLIIDNPDKAFLHANLGDYFVGRGEWLAAQAAYFEAFAKKPGNANYAFNLAVCLDQLGKGEIALRYYQQALALRTSSASRFDEKSALARVQVLEGMSR